LTTGVLIFFFRRSYAVRHRTIPVRFRTTKHFPPAVNALFSKASGIGITVEIFDEARKRRPFIN
jgi:hypothetical protein